MTPENNGLCEDWGESIAVSSSIYTDSRKIKIGNANCKISQCSFC